MATMSMRAEQAKPENAAGGFFQHSHKQAKEAVRIARTSFKFGEASLLAQRVLWQTFQSYAEARFELSVALTELVRLVGKEL